MFCNLLTSSRLPSDYGLIVDGLSADIFSEIIASAGKSLLTAFAVSILTIICLWRIFRKAGRQGWPAIIPFYKTYSLYKISWGSGWLFLFECLPCAFLFVPVYFFFKQSAGSISEDMLSVPVLILVIILAITLSAVALFISIITYYKLAKAFGKTGWFTLGLLFMNPLFLAILAFGHAQYIGIAVDATVEDLPYGMDT